MTNQPLDFLSVIPSDFHHLKAKFSLPLAPVFLPRPIRTTRTFKPISNSINQQIKNETEEEEEEISIRLESTKDLSNRLDNSGGAIEAINQILSTLLMKYIPNLGCVLLSYLSPPIFIFKDQNGNEFNQTLNSKINLPFQTIVGSGWSIINIKVNLLGWRPKIGDRLIGKPTMSSPSHLSLILYQTFNAFIPANHMLGSGYRYDPNVEIPSSWKFNAKDQKFNNHDQKVDDQDDGFDHEINERGCWVDSNGVVVGGETGVMTFTAISLTITNDMISVTGSLLSDPFSVPPSGYHQPTKPNRTISPSQASNSSNSSDEDDLPTIESINMNPQNQNDQEVLRNLPPPSITSSHMKKKSSKSKDLGEASSLIETSKHGLQIDSRSNQLKRSGIHDPTSNQSPNKKKKKKTC